MRNSIQFHRRHSRSIGILATAVYYYFVLHQNYVSSLHIRDTVSFQEHRRLVSAEIETVCSYDPTPVERYIMLTYPIISDATIPTLRDNLAAMSEMFKESYNQQVDCMDDPNSFRYIESAYFLPFDDSEETSDSTEISILLHAHLSCSGCQNANSTALIFPPPQIQQEQDERRLMRLNLIQQQQQQQQQDYLKSHLRGQDNVPRFSLASYSSSASTSSSSSLRLLGGSGSGSGSGGSGGRDKDNNKDNDKDHGKDNDDSRPDSEEECMCPPPNDLYVLELFESSLSSIDPSLEIIGCMELAQADQCEAPILTPDTMDLSSFSTVLWLQVEGNPYDVGTDQMLTLEQTVMATYNAINANTNAICDVERHIVTSVTVDAIGMEQDGPGLFYNASEYNTQEVDQEDGTRRQLFAISFDSDEDFYFFIKLIVIGSCRGCEESGGIFYHDDSTNFWFERRLVFNEWYTSPENISELWCLCPVQAEQRVPTATEFMDAFDKLMNGESIITDDANHPQDEEGAGGHNDQEGKEDDLSFVNTIVEVNEAGCKQNDDGHKSSNDDRGRGRGGGDSDDNRGNRE